MSHPVEWATASPLWEGTPQPPARDPLLLRFASDSFMEELQALLDTEPATLAALRATRESFRARPLGKDDTWQSPLPPLLKLYQPIHGHFYLVAAALVCRIPGFPDHEVQPAHQERVSFVLRRLGAAGELAWSIDPVHGKGWVGATADGLAPYEERHPLAPVNFTVAGGRRRRLFVGLVPTATRDTYRAAPGVDPYPTTKADATKIDTRPTEAAARVVDALASIADLRTAPPDEAAHFALLDFADFLHSRLDEEMWTKLMGDTRPSDERVQTLYDLLSSTAVGPTLTMRTALKRALAQTDAITGESGKAVEFPATIAADVRSAALALVPPEARPRGATLLSAIVKALPPSGATTASDGTIAAAVEVPKLAAVPSIDGGSPPRFRLRCVYERPQCRPIRPFVSQPTETFTFAPFFDFDAPTRPIRIVLPIDTSIKDLRKFRKNVSFVVSEQLKNQMNQVKGLKDVMDGNLASGDSATVGFGLICSFSIPIITICALIVLMIFLSLLNIVFWWVPFFRICFPFPKRVG